MKEHAQITRHLLNPEQLVIQYQPQLGGPIVYMTSDFTWSQNVSDAQGFDTVTEATLFMAIANQAAEVVILKHQVQALSKIIGGVG